MNPFSMRKTGNAGFGRFLILVLFLIVPATVHAEEVRAPEIPDLSQKNIPEPQKQIDAEEAALQARFAALANSLGKIPRPPKVNKTIHLPMMEMEVVRDDEDESK